MKNSIRTLVIVAMLHWVSSVAASPVIEDFTSGNYTTVVPVLSTSDDIAFSNNLYTHNDGFFATESAATNNYGEHNQYFTFNNPVSLTSIDFKKYATLTYVNNVEVTVFDTLLNLIDTQSFVLTDQWNTINFGVNDASLVNINFLGKGFNYYNDGRDHSWWMIDNISFDTSNNLYPVSNVPVPAAAWLFGTALIGLIGFGKRRKAT